MARAWLHLNLNKRATIMACAQESGERTVELAERVGKSRVLVVGGTGRVGSSTAIALSKLCPDLRIVVAGRNREKGSAVVAKLGKNSEFAEVDIDDMESVEKALHDVDLVVHTAGPFQQADRCAVLEAAIQTKVRKRQPTSMYVMIQDMHGVQNPI